MESCNETQDSSVTNVTHDGSFNFEEWKSQGEKAYQAVGAEISRLQERLSILQENKRMLASILGLSAPRQTGTKRVPVTPMVLSAMQDLKGPITVDGLYAHLSAGVPELKRQSFNEAIRRMCADDSSPLTQTADGRLTV